MRKRVPTLMLLLLFFSLLFCSCMAPLEETDGETVITDVFVDDTPTDETEGAGDGKELPLTEEETPLEKPSPSKNFQTLLSVTASSLNVRLKPYATSKIIGSADKGDLLPLEGETEEFYQTFYANETAYVSKKFTEKITLEKSSSETVEKILWAAQRELGSPYVYGAARYLFSNGTLNKDFIKGVYDCSSLMQYAFYVGSGKVLGMTTRDQVLQGREIKKEDLRRGDLLFFTNSARKELYGIERVGHVAVYLGNNYILHTASDFAVIEKISDARRNNFITARRIIELPLGDEVVDG